MRTLFLIICSLLTFIFSCNNEPEKRVEMVADEQNVMHGKIIAQTAASTLMGKLTSSLSERGSSGSIMYCNTIGLPLLDSISKVYNAKIGRTSLKVRNLNNIPDEMEREVLQEWEKLMLKGISPGIVMKVIDTSHSKFFAPIFVQSFCLQCHGKPGLEILDRDLAIIDSLYPKDMARNYKPGDLRGMWSISLSH